MAGRITAPASPSARALIPSSTIRSSAGRRSTIRSTMARSSRATGTGTGTGTGTPTFIAPGRSGACGAGMAAACSSLARVGRAGGGGVRGGGGGGGDGGGGGGRQVGGGPGLFRVVGRLARLGALERGGTAAAVRARRVDG